MKNTLFLIQGDLIKSVTSRGKSAIIRVLLLYSMDAVSRPEYFPKGHIEIYPTIHLVTEKSAVESRKIGDPNGYFYCTLWTRFHVPNTFLRDEKYPTIQGDWEIGNESRKIGNQGVLSLYSLDAVSRPEYFHKGWKIPYYTGWLRNRQRSRKIGNQRVLSLYSLDAVSRPEYFHKGWKIPYYTGSTEKSATIEENRQSKGTFIVLFGRGFTSRVLS